jgi:hypothetical protein
VADDVLEVEVSCDVLRVELIRDPDPQHLRPGMTAGQPCRA